MYFPFIIELFVCLNNETCMNKSAYACASSQLKYLNLCYKHIVYKAGINAEGRYPGISSPPPPPLLNFFIFPPEFPSLLPPSPPPPPPKKKLTQCVVNDVSTDTKDSCVNLTLCTVARLGLVVARHAPLKWRAYV